MIRINTAAITLCLLGALPLAASAQSQEFGARDGDREFSISGTGNSDRNVDSGSFGVTGDLGWYLGDKLVAGIRQSVNYASIEGESVKDDFWNGASRAYLNYQFLDDRSRPFVGASLGGIYGDGVKNSSTNDASEALQDSGIWAYTVGMGYNF